LTCSRGERPSLIIEQKTPSGIRNRGKRIHRFRLCTDDYDNCKDGDGKKAQGNLHTFTRSARNNTLLNTIITAKKKVGKERNRKRRKMKKGRRNAQK
jgi:hypothetical protein